MVAKKRKKKGDGRLKWRTIIIPFSTLQFWVNFFIVLVAFAALLFLGYFQFLSPKAQARRLINQAEKQFDEAIVLGIKELSFDEFQAVQEGLFKARQAYDGRQHQEARLLAEQTLASLDKAMEKLRSDEYYRKERAATMKHVKGDIEVNVAGSLEWQPAKKGQKLKRGDKVRTRGGSGCVVQFDDGSQLTIKSDSLVLIDELNEDIRTRTKNSAIKLLVSDVEASVLRPTSRGSRFTIETPGSVAQVKKARVSIRVNKNNETEYKLISGDVTVNTGKRDIQLGSSEVIKLGKTGGVMSRGRLVGVPQPRSPENLHWFVSREESLPVRFSWKTVPEAGRYRLTVATDRYFSNVTYDNRQIKGNSAVIRDLEPGLYFWRVSSFDRRGQESLSSSFRVVRLVRDQTPPQFTLNDPVVFADAGGKRVYFSGAVEPGSVLTMNGRRIPTAQDGNFRSFLSLGKDQGALRIRASDAAGNVLSQLKEIQ